MESDMNYDYNSAWGKMTFKERMRRQRIARYVLYNGKSKKQRMKMEEEFASQLHSWIIEYMRTHDNINLAYVIGSMELVKKDIIEEVVAE